MSTSLKVGCPIPGNRASGGQRADLAGDPLSGVDQCRDNIVNGGEWFSVAAFANPATGFFGTAGRNIITGPGNWNLDFGMLKNFMLTERFRLEYRWEMLSAFNHASLTNPAGNINSGSAGEINTLTGPRIMQMGLRMTF